MIQDSSTLVQYYDDLLTYTEGNVSDVAEELKTRGVSLCILATPTILHSLATPTTMCGKVNL